MRMPLRMEHGTTVAPCQDHGCAALMPGKRQRQNIEEPCTGCRVRADTFSKSKYASVVTQAGGWEWLQALLSALHSIAQKHGSDIATVASKWVLDQPQVSEGASLKLLLSRHMVCTSVWPCHPPVPLWQACMRLTCT